MGRREARKITRKTKQMADDRGQMTEGPQLVAIGRISGGVSVTYVPFQSMPGVDEIATTAIRKVIRALHTQ